MSLSDNISAGTLCEGLGAEDDIIEFSHAAGTSVVFGNGVVSRVGEIAREIGGSRALIVTDPGIAGAGHAEWVMSSLKCAGLEVSLFIEVNENPTTEDVARCVEVASDERIDILIGLGGGSSMDTAKGCNFILTNGGEMKDYWGSGKATKEMLPLIAIPTTAGTGSECQSFALIADAKTHMKMACGDRKAAAKVAILDPELTLTQPASVTAHTGIDALTHAIESAVTKSRSEVSMAYSRLSFSLLNEGFEAVIKNPECVRSRAMVQLGAAYAGVAIENSMLGAAHAAANPLTAHFGIVHGQAVGVMMPHVIEFNSKDDRIREIYKELYTGNLSERVSDLMAMVGMSAGISGYSIDGDLIQKLANEASRQWTAGFNPRKVESEDFVRLYASAM
ncbi:MAG: iron-containing alcohol dehydrogenase [Verrucomicrobiaceae bacterium]|nr:iron-containing alcohol dehydrogenase [Verrucomicrobiaceae bacterium]